jgi:hypothetical protein
MNNTLEYMKKKGISLTRENYLDFAYLGNPPEELSAEEEAEIPSRLTSEEAKPETKPWTFQDAVTSSYDNNKISGSDADHAQTGDAGSESGETKQS